MPPKPFYEVNPKTYLFGKSVSPEEQVRQWVLFELIAHYGYRINKIQTEVSCKIGSKYFSADVVVFNDETPFIVIECKRQEDEKSEEALKQVESYASFLKCDFLVFTNGKSWIVKRNIQGFWSIVTDIPSSKMVGFKKTIPETLKFVETIKPLLYWMYQSVPKEKARKFLEKLLYFFQSEFFSREMLLEMNIRRVLLVAVEKLLCVIGAGSIETIDRFDEDSYKMEKLKDSLFLFEEYLENIGHKSISKHENFDDYYFRELLGMFYDIDEVIKNHRGISNNELLLLKIIKAITDYTWGVFEKKEYIEIKENLMRVIELFIDETLKLELNSELPDSLDTDVCDIMRIYSSEEWEIK